MNDVKEIKVYICSITSAIFIIAALVVENAYSFPCTISTFKLYFTANGNVIVKLKDI